MILILKDKLQIHLVFYEKHLYIFANNFYFKLFTKTIGKTNQTTNKLILKYFQTLGMLQYGASA